MTINSEIACFGLFQNNVMHLHSPADRVATDAMMKLPHVDAPTALRDECTRLYWGANRSKMAKSSTSLSKDSRNSLIGVFNSHNTGG